VERLARGLFIALTCVYLLVPLKKIELNSY